MVKVTQFISLTAMPGALAQAASPSAVFCTDADFGGTCITLPVVSDSCVDFKNGLSNLYHTVSSVQIPDNYVCVLSEDYGCAGRQVDVLGGSWNLASYNFDDLTGSFSCSAI